MRLAAVQDLLYGKVIQDGCQPADMILVRVGGDNEIEACGPVVSQVGFHHAAHFLGAAIYEDILSIELQEFRVALAHVQEITVRFWPENAEAEVARIRAENRANCRRCLRLLDLFMLLFPREGCYIGLRIKRFSCKSEDFLLTGILQPQV